MISEQYSIIEEIHTMIQHGYFPLENLSFAECKEKVVIAPITIIRLLTPSDSGEHNTEVRGVRKNIYWGCAITINSNEFIEFFKYLALYSSLEKTLTLKQETQTEQEEKKSTHVILTIKLEEVHAVYNEIFVTPNGHICILAGQAKKMNLSFAPTTKSGNTEFMVQAGYSLFAD